MIQACAKFVVGMARKAKKMKKRTKKVIRNIRMNRKSPQDEIYSGYEDQCSAPRWGDQTGDEEDPYYVAPVHWLQYEITAEDPEYDLEVLAEDQGNGPSDEVRSLVVSDITGARKSDRVVERNKTTPEALKAEARESVEEEGDSSSGQIENLAHTGDTVEHKTLDPYL